MTNLKAAQRLVSHIRQCFISLLDGRTYFSKRDINYWIALKNDSPQYWDYPVITPSVLSDCKELGINIHDEIIGLSGLKKFVSFLQIVEKPLCDILRKAKVEEGVVKTEEHFRPELYLNTLVHDLPAAIKLIDGKHLPGISFYLHGSVADFSNTAFSDIDDLVIIRNSAWENTESLVRSAEIFTKMARKYQNIDPLQHHGHWAITEFDLLLYDLSYLPLIALNKLVCVVGDLQIKFRFQTDYEGFIRNGVLTADSIREKLKKAEIEREINIFNLKCLVGEIAILPSYIFQSKGFLLTKKEAIRRAKTIFTKEALAAIIWASSIRKEFQPLVDNRRIKFINALANLVCARRHQAELLYRKWSTLLNDQSQAGLKPEILKSIRSFAKESKAMLISSI